MTDMQSFLQDPFGNYVVQYVLELGHVEATATIMRQLYDHYPELAQQKFSSNVVEKCLKLGGPGLAECRERVIRELMVSPLLPRLLQASVVTLTGTSMTLWYVLLVSEQLNALAATKIHSARLLGHIRHIRLQDSGGVKIFSCAGMFCNLPLICRSFTSRHAAIKTCTHKHLPICCPGLSI